MLILYKVIIFIFFKDYFVEEYYKFCVLFFNHIKINLNISQDMFDFYKEKKKNYIYNHKYNYCNKASYHGSVYIVKPGDTLYYIAWLTGNNYVDLAKNNNIKNLNRLQINQVLKIKNNTIKSFFSKKIFKKILLPFFDDYCKIKQLFIFDNKKKITLKVKKYISCCFDKKNDSFSYCKKKNTVIMSNLWNWPTYGAIINTFSETEGGNTGIDISGVFDQPILATTNGQVVYVGNVLKGYGNLVIIKHNGDYLSAYAHNNKILVTERQHVKIGDQIATMGNSGTNEIKLHFEIRYKGNSINPLCLLP